MGKNTFNNKKDVLLDFPSTILEEMDDNEDMISMVSDIDSKFENSILSFMEQKNDSMHKEIEKNTKLYHKYLD